MCLYISPENFNILINNQKRERFSVPFLLFRKTNTLQNVEFHPEFLQIPKTVFC
jgi:hypothetical protein